MLSKNKLQEFFYRMIDKIGLLEAPKSIQWISTHKCNLSCRHCMVNAGKPLDDELTTNEVKKFIKDISKMGVQTFFITGGEPLMRTDIFEILNFANNHRLNTGIATNGILIQKYKKEIFSSNLNSIMVSLDGLEETHKKIRGSTVDYNELLDSIKFLRTTKIPKIAVCTTVNKLNFLELNQLRDLILSLNIDIWKINMILPRGRAKNNLLLDNHEIKELIKFIKENGDQIKISVCSEAGYLGNSNKRIRGNSYFFCSCGWTSCTLMANGDIMACPIYEKNIFIEGNIRRNSFKEIWEKGLKKFRNISLKDSCSKCQHLPNCGGGCKVMRILNRDCLIDVLNKKTK